jgi:tetratricopeptide (TPR) repeat protein
MANGLIRTVVLCGALLWHAMVRPVSAQTNASSGSPSAMAAAASRADSAFVRGNNPGAIDPLRPWLESPRADVPLLWRGARAYVVYGILATSRQESEAHLLRASAYARRALQLAPQDVHAHYWLAVATGRRALRGDFWRILPLAIETYTQAYHILTVDSLHAGAHNIIGKLYSEVRKQPWAIRKLAANITRKDVMKYASWSNAELYLKRAVVLDPTSVVYRADLAQLYHRMGRHADAAAVVAQMESMPERTPVDRLFKQDMRRLVFGAAKARGN